MLSSLTTKIALRKVGLPTNTFSSLPDFSFSDPNAKKLRKDPPPGWDPNNPEDDSGWPAWMSVRSLPLSVQPWLTPPPPAVTVAKRIPGIGDAAPIDKSGKLVFPKGRRTLVVFMRCVGCAFAQKTFLNLRTLANRHQNLTCVAISHASPAATEKWLTLIGGAWNVKVIIDQDRALYAAWGLGTASAWYVLNPSVQAQSWKESGWLGDKVASAVQRQDERDASRKAAAPPPSQARPRMARVGTGFSRSSRRSTDEDKDSVVEEQEEKDEGPLTTMGNKWQEAGAFAVDGSATVIWGGKALRADDVMDLEMGAKILLS